MVNEMASIAFVRLESDCGERVSNLTARYRAFFDEVKVVGDVLAIRPDRDASSARERCCDANILQRLTNQARQFFRGHHGNWLHSGLPLRLGRARLSRR